MLGFIICRWHLIAQNMPTITVIKIFDIIKNISVGFFPRSVIIPKRTFGSPANWVISLIV